MNLSDHGQAMDNANAQYVGKGNAPTLMTAKAGAAIWRQQDYAWTHTAPVEGFFVVLTIVIVPVAILRWLRSLRSTLLDVYDRHCHDADS
jgi:hypothetical protein